MEVAKEISLGLSCGLAVALVSYAIGISVLPGALLAPAFYWMQRST